MPVNFTLPLNLGAASPPFSILVSFSLCLLAFVPLWVAGAHREFREGYRVESPRHMASEGAFPPTPRIFQQPEKQSDCLPCTTQEEAALEGSHKGAAGSVKKPNPRFVFWGQTLNICLKPACGFLSCEHGALRCLSSDQDSASRDTTSLSASASTASSVVLGSS